MNIIPETDRVIRSFLPVMLQAAGHSESASELRGLDPIESSEGIVIAAGRLEELAVFVHSESDTMDDRWQPIIEDALFWCKAAMWAAARQDLVSFRDHLIRLNNSMSEGMELITLN